MDQIVAQALTVYAKMVSTKRADALLLAHGHQNGNHKPPSRATITTDLTLVGGQHGEIRKAV
jgi:hypothetical protein